MNRFTEELRVIPGPVWVLAALFPLGMLAFGLTLPEWRGFARAGS